MNGYRQPTRRAASRTTPPPSRGASGPRWASRDGSATTPPTPSTPSGSSCSPHSSATRTLDCATRQPTGASRTAVTSRRRGCATSCRPRRRRCRPAFAGTAATVNANTNLRWPSATQARATQARPYVRTQRSAVTDFSSPSLVVLRLRALFGVGARAEVVRAFLADPSVRLSAADVAADAGYTKRNVAEALDVSRVAGLLRVAALPKPATVRTRRRRVAHVPAGRPPGVPGRRWSSVFRVLEGLIAGTRAAERLPTRARTVEASAILRDLRGDLEQVGVRLSQEEVGPGASPTMERLSS